MLPMMLAVGRCDALRHCSSISSQTQWDLQASGGRGGPSGTVSTILSPLLFRFRGEFQLATPRWATLAPSYSLGVERHVAEAISGLEGPHLDGAEVMRPAAPVDVLLGAEVEVVCRDIARPAPLGS